MEESIFGAREEIKRADHLIFVSLKYTRTVDVFKSIIQRLINVYDHLMDALLKHKGVDIPKVPRVKVELVKSTYPDDELVQDHMKLYLFLRAVDRAPFDRRLEYRRHVTMTAHLDDKEIEISIDIIEEYFRKVKHFFEYVEQLGEDQS
ncbi:MAG: hypothetical protein ACE5FT_07465 [Candidatus Nanoarchaeia archaeon]